MLIDRRALLLGIGAGLLLPPPALAERTSATRRFVVRRDGAPVGTKTVTVSRAGDRTEVEVGVDIAVKILGITAYRYRMRNRELWEDGLLQSIEASTDDDGVRDFVTAARQGDAIAIRGSRFEGEAPGDAATTTYWCPAFLARPVWISTQGGQPLRVSVAPLGRRRLDLPAGPVEAEAWRVSGDLSIELFYAEGEWVANRFEARGEPAEIVAESLGARLSPLFSA